METRDLSFVHKPVSKVFLEEVVTPENIEKYKLSDDQVEFYRDYGYVADVKILSDNQCDILCEELEDISHPEYHKKDLWYEFHSNESTDPDTVLLHALGAWRMTHGFHDILWHPAFLVPASQLLGGSVRFWHDQLFSKPKKHGGVVAWHQDYSFWTRSKPMCHLTCWLGLDDVSTENGCLHYVPASHEWPLLPKTNLAGNMTAIQEVLSERQKEQFNPVPIEMKRGHATFHHPLLVHGSYENKSDRPRRATVINSALDGFYSDTDQPLLEGVPVIPPGRKIGGQFFPLLFDAEAVK